MLTRIKMFWVKIRDSLWFLPATFTTLAGALAVVLIEIEKREILVLGDSTHWLWGGGVEGVRGVLSAIAGGLITVTGVVFSVTVVALQLASSQFTPRLLRHFTADRSNQMVLGVFIATFTYTLLVLRVVRADTEGQAQFVPRIAVTIALALVLISIGFLIYFIDHASKSIQLSFILDRVTRQTIGHVKLLLPEPADDPGNERKATWDRPEGEPFLVTAAETGYLQAVDTSGLLEFGEKRALFLLMEPHIGQFVLSGTALASVWPADETDEEAIRVVRRAFVLGLEPTPEQDVEFGIIEISDIAVKALSPSVNDPTTALRCMDRLAEVLVAIGQRTHQPRSHLAPRRIHFLAQPLEFARVVGLAFDQIRHFGSDNPTVGRKFVDLLTQMMDLLPPERHAPLQSQLEAVITDSRRAIKSPVELSAFERMLEANDLGS